MGRKCLAFPGKGRPLSASRKECISRQIQVETVEELVINEQKVPSDVKFSMIRVLCSIQVGWIDAELWGRYCSVGSESAVQAAHGTDFPNPPILWLHIKPATCSSIVSNVRKLSQFLANSFRYSACESPFLVHLFLCPFSPFPSRNKVIFTLVHDVLMFWLLMCWTMYWCFLSYVVHDVLMAYN